MGLIHGRRTRAHNERSAFPTTTGPTRSVRAQRIITPDWVELATVANREPMSARALAFAMTYLTTILASGGVAVDRRSPSLNVISSVRPPTPEKDPRD